MRNLNPVKLRRISKRSPCVLPSTLSDEFKNHFESIRQRKFPQANLDFQEDAALKGGVVIAVGDLLLDFSLSKPFAEFLVMNASRKKILVIVPAFNECGNIGRTVEEIRKAAKDVDILVIDDGSLDATAQEAASGRGHGGFFAV